MAKVDLDKLNKLVKQNYISVKSHPEVPELLVWNYTKNAQYEQYWTPETMMCRGLITDTTGKILARPFSKFFNWSEVSTEIPDERFEITMKMDGSLGVLVWYEGVPYISTRGSFDSEQARHATKLYRERYGRSHKAHPEYTYLFEIVYPANRIVVDYGDMDDLVLIGVIHTETGKEVPLRVMHDQPFPVAKVYDGINDIQELMNLPSENQEGFVIRFEPSNMRYKMKFDAYVRLHGLVTEVNKRRIWELLSEGESVSHIIEHVPDEFYKWARSTIEDFQRRYVQIEIIGLLLLRSISHLKTHKEKWAALDGSPYQWLVFRMLKHQRYSHMIWEYLYPEHSPAFAFQDSENKGEDDAA